MLTYVGNSAVAVLRRGWESARWHARSRLDLRMPSLDRKVFCLLYVGTVVSVATLGAVVGLPVLLREARARRPSRDDDDAREGLGDEAEAARALDPLRRSTS